MFKKEFEGLEGFFRQLEEEGFRRKPFRYRFREVNALLLRLILGAEEPCFLLPAVVHFIARINEEELLDEPYRIASFENWMNLYADLSLEEQSVVRSKIVGKKIPRSSYQEIFPVGNNRVYPGPHFVAGHFSPDVDTTIASFFGWLDAFGARLSEGNHFWCVPGGVNESHLARLFQEYLGDSVFLSLLRPQSTLTISASDLVSKANMVKLKKEQSITQIDHSAKEKALILVDDRSHFLGEWRASDAEAVRQVAGLFKACLHAFENDFHGQLISFFAERDVFLEKIPEFLSSVFDRPLSNFPVVSEYTEEQVELLDQLIRILFHEDAGVKTTYRSLMERFRLMGLKGIVEFNQEIEGIQGPRLFDVDGHLIENRPHLFQKLKNVIDALDHAIYEIRIYLERLDVSILIKERVLGLGTPFVTLENDVAEIEKKMGDYSYLTVMIPEDGGLYFPLGVVRSSQLRKTPLGTVSLRDFSNMQEVHMAPYLDVISIIDHHKVDIKTNIPAQINIADAQSCNVLLAEKAFQMNEPYSTLGKESTFFEEAYHSIPFGEENALRRKRALLKRLAACSSGGWIDPAREWLENFFFLVAVLDDTDLLSKVTARDVECVERILNTLTSLEKGEETFVVDISDLKADHDYAKKAAERLLKTPEMYGVYKKSFAYKELSATEAILECVQGKSLAFFQDTKVQNGCCRVGQTKLFRSNFPVFLENEKKLRAIWVKEALASEQYNSDLDLFLQMISTIPSADEVYAKEKVEYSHRDEIWLFVPESASLDHLVRFLNNFRSSREVVDNYMELYLDVKASTRFKETFERHFIKLPLHTADLGSPSLAVLRFNPGSINSRKTMITPYLPTTV